jgi:hypothetical protein
LDQVNSAMSGSMQSDGVGSAKTCRKDRRVLLSERADVGAVTWWICNYLNEFVPQVRSRRGEVSFAAQAENCTGGRSNAPAVQGSSRR